MKNVILVLLGMLIGGGSFIFYVSQDSEEPMVYLEDDYSYLETGKEIP